MIHIKLETLTLDEAADVHLPAVPRRGDRIVIDTTSYTVHRVHFFPDAAPVVTAYESEEL